MYTRPGLGNAEQDALNAIRNVSRRFLDLATGVQRLRNTLSVAESMGVSRDEIFEARSKVNSFEADYRAIRGRMLFVGDLRYLARVTSGSASEMLATIRKLLDRFDSLAALVQRVAHGRLPDKEPGVTDNLKGMAKWVAIGVIAYVALDVSRAVRSSRA